MGRRQNVSGDHCGYYLFFNYNNLECLFKRTHDPDEEVIDESCRLVQSNNLLQVVELLVNPFSCHKKLL